MVRVAKGENETGRELERESEWNLGEKEAE